MTTSDLTCNQILKGIARSVWEKDGNKGEPPAIPTVEALVEYDAYKLGSVIYPLVEKLNTAQEILGKTGPIYQTPELREACDRIIDTVAAEDNFKRTLFDTVAAFGFVDVLIADFAERIERLHAYWQAVRDRGEKIPHILEPIVRAWLVGQIPKVEPTRRQDTGILHHAIGETHPTPRLPMTVMETVPGEPEQLMLLKSLPQVELQLELPGFVFPESELVPALPLEAYDTVGGKPSQQGGGAPISQRLFCNVLVEYAQKQRGLYSTARLNTNYRDVKSWLYPKGTTNPKSVLIPDSTKECINCTICVFCGNAAHGISSALIRCPQWKLDPTTL